MCRGYRTYEHIARLVPGERMGTCWQCCASVVLVIVLVMSNREVTARNRTVEQKIRDDPDLSEVSTLKFTVAVSFILQ